MSSPDEVAKLLNKDKGIGTFLKYKRQWDDYYAGLQNIIKSVESQVDRYNILKDYFKAIADNDKVTIDTFKNYDTLSGLSTPLKEQLIEKAQQSKAAIKKTRNNNPIDLNYAVDNLLKGEALSEAQQNAIITTYTNYLKKDVGDIFSEIYPQLIKDFDALSANMFEEIMYMQSAIISDQTFISTPAKADAVIADAMTTVNKNVSADQIILIQDGFRREFGTGDAIHASVQDVIEFLGKHDVLNEAVLTAKSFEGKFFGANTYDGPGAKFLTFKGYAGYDPDLKTNFRSITVTGTYTPNFIISHDAANMRSMMANVPGLSQKFDAVFGNITKMEEAAKIGNERMNDIRLYENGMTQIKDAYSNVKEAYDKIKGQGNSKDRAYMWMAQQNLMARNIAPIGDALDMEVAKIKDLEYSIEGRSNSGADTNKWKDRRDALDTDIARVEQEIADNKAKLLQEPNKVVAQYSNGSPNVVARSGDSKPISINNDASSRANAQSHDFEWLDHLDPDTVDGKIMRLDTFWEESIDAYVKAIEDIIFDSKDPDLVKSGKLARLDSAGNVIIKSSKADIGSKISIGDFLEVLSHESAHKVLDNNGIAFKEFHNALNDMMTDAQGFRDKDGNMIRITTADMLADDTELAVKIVGQLLRNELIIKNADQIGKFFGTTKLKDQMEPIMRGNDVIYTTQDLYTHMKDKNFDSIVAEQFKQLSVKTIGTLNSLANVKAFFLGLEPEQFSTTMNGMVQTLLTSSERIREVNAKISEIPFFELMAINPQKEAMELMLSIKQGTEAELERGAAVLTTEVTNLLEEAGGKDVGIALGNLQSMGIIATLDEFKLSKTKEDYLQRVKQSSDKLYSEMKKIASGRENNLNAFVKKIHALADGSDMNKAELVDKFLKSINKDPAFVLKNSQDAISFVEKEAANYLMHKNSEVSTGKNGAFDNAFRQINIRSDVKPKVEELLTIADQFKNKHSLFGDVNPEVNLRNHAKRGVLVAKDAHEGQPILGNVTIEDKSFYVVEANDGAYYIGKQESQIMDVSFTDFESDFYTVKSDNKNIILRPQAMNLSNSHIDNSFTTMIKRNYYNNKKRSIAADSQYRQYEIAKKEGIVISHSEFQDMVAKDPSLAKNYKKMPSANPISESFGTHYYNEKWKHYFEGTSGINIADKARQAFGNNDVARFATSLVKMGIGATKAFKGLILQTRVSSYINSGLSSVGIYTMHADAPYKFPLHMKQAKQLTDSYKVAVSDLVKAEMKGDADAIRIAKAAVEGHKLHDAFTSAIASTLRSDAYKTGSYNENEIVSLLSNTFSSEIADRVRPLLLDPSTPIGNKIGQIYDSVEMYPKIALYLDKLESTGDVNVAKQTVLMAFPTYNNLNPMFAAIDTVSPYTKYMTNFPKMFMYTLDQHPYRFAAMHTAALTLPPMTLDENDAQERELLEKGSFLKLPFTDQAWYYDSSYNYFLPSKTFTGNPEEGALQYLVNYDFLAEAPFAIFDFTPTRSIH